jgi:DNA polymerase I-like protein with 3'-5' exonuclease and polymerase domains
LQDIKATGLKSVIIGQIHDAIIALVKEGEEDALARIIYHNGVERVSKEFPWICVPLVIEAETSAVGGSWANMTDVGALGPDGIADTEWHKKFEQPHT